MKKLFLAVLFILATSQGWAYQQTPSDFSRTDPAIGASRKLGRGLSNAGLGWLELFKGMQSVGEEKGFWAGATWGPLYGAVNAIKRTGIGVAEAVTFPVGGKNNYQPIIRPEFVLGDENNG